MNRCKVRLNVPIDHAYGKTSKVYKYGVREIMKTCEPCEFKIELLKSIAYLNKIRYLLKQRETYFPDVIVYIKEKDKVSPLYYCMNCLLHYTCFHHFYLFHCYRIIAKIYINMNY